MISLRLESAAYGGTRVLRAIDLTVKPGQLVVLVGINGGGKTTLLRCLAGLHREFTGECRLADRPFADWSPTERARHLAFLPQSSVPGFSFRVREVLAMGRYAFDDAPENLAERIKCSAAEFDLEHLLSRQVDCLSGGEWQRVALARTFLQDAALLILDEPTAHLDLPHRFRSFASCRHAADAGRAVLCATHDFDAALEYADRVVVLHGGTLWADGTVSDVFNDDLLRTLFGTAPVRFSPHPISGRPQLVVDVRALNREDTK